MTEGNVSKLSHYVSNNPSRLLVLSSVLGMARTLVALPLQHPWDVIKVNWQANSHLKNELAVYKMVKAEKGLKGFYSGFNTNLTKQLFKSFYRYPLLSGLPRFYSQILGNKYDSNKHSMKLLTSVTIALIEAGLVSPLERLQVFIMTSKFGHQNYIDFYNMSRNKLRTELFRGFTSYALKQ